MVTATATRPLNVLIVEDNPDAALAFQALFHVYGHNALIAQDGEEAIEMAHSERIDVVICDLGLPKKDGFEVVRTLRADSRMPYLPVCALTARSDEQSRRTAAAVGFDGYIVKPPRFPELLAFLKRYQREQAKRTNSAIGDFFSPAAISASGASVGTGGVSDEAHPSAA